ncbi:MAG: TPM domain-containing protein [Deltaproteobacteria bacterium]|nr:TPM domain-containing protein [Deltaproteobacteria bacterium]
MTNGTSKSSAVRCGFCALLLAVLAALVPFPATGKESFPAPVGAVNDFAGVIRPEYAEKMELLASEVLDKTGTSMVVATVKTIGDNDPADYANRLYQAWGIGKKGENKGVLIFLALTERKVRIETGYGVEAILPDGRVGEILDSYVLPYLRKGDYSQGLSNAVTVVSAVVAKDAQVSLTGLPPVKKAVTGREERRGGLLPLIIGFIVISLLLGTSQGRAALPYILLMLIGGSGRGGGGGFGGFGGGGFGGFGGGASGGGGAGRDF